ncbi:MAG TPA: oxygenase MpaB family protein [Solirubrobacteraceae bacterium]|nr:oxygenase MpaB family protein [Solirubrobacteraceae bacterium]
MAASKRERASRAGKRPGSTSPQTAADHGLFGPGSATWKVHSNPVMLVGGLRALLIQALHPLAMAGVAQYSDFRSDPLRRLRGTSAYVHAVTFGDIASAQAAADRVRRLHKRVRGVDTVTGRSFSASDPETLLWVHCVEVHSFLAAYRAYGGRIGAAEQDRYLAEQVAAAELMEIPRASVPASRAAYRAYFAEVLPTLCSSVQAAATIAFVRRPQLSGSVWLAPVTPALRTLAQAATALVPRSLRPLAGLPEWDPRTLPAAAAVVLAARAMILSRRVPWLGAQIETQVGEALGVGSLPDSSQEAA